MKKSKVLFLLSSLSLTTLSSCDFFKIIYEDLTNKEPDLILTFDSTTGIEIVEQNLKSQKIYNLEDETKELTDGTVLSSISSAVTAKVKEGTTSKFNGWCAINVDNKGNRNYFPLSSYKNLIFPSLSYSNISSAIDSNALPLISEKHVSLVACSYSCNLKFTNNLEDDKFFERNESLFQGGSASFEAPLISGYQFQGWYYGDKTSTTPVITKQNEVEWGLSLSGENDSIVKIDDNYKLISTTGSEMTYTFCARYKQI